MKLAQALIERADLQRRLEQLNQRLRQNAQHQEGEMPAEDPNELLKEYFSASEQLQRLVVNINLANNRVQLENGQLMVDALAQRDKLKNQHATLIALANAAMPESRYSRSEIKTLSAVNVKQLRMQADQLAQQHRALDMQIQQANWTNEL